MAVNDLLLVNSSFNKDNDSNHQEDEAVIPKMSRLFFAAASYVRSSLQVDHVTFFQRKKLDVSSTGKSGRRHFFFVVCPTAVVNERQRDGYEPVSCAN
jgi:hypothetical protein